MGFETRARTRTLGWLCLGLVVVLLLGMNLLDVARVPATIGLAIIIPTAFFTSWRSRRNRDAELARFIDAITFDDATQVFGGRGPPSLASALDNAMRRFRDKRATLQRQSRFNAGLVESSPVPLLMIDQFELAELVNSSARKLLRTPYRVPVRKLGAFGSAFVDVLATLEPGEHRAVTMDIDSVPQQTLLTASSISSDGETLRIVAIQPMQGMLDGAVTAAQLDLVRVLTHEIMNSITPVTSLARTSVDLLTRLQEPRTPELAKVVRAIETLADRADGIMRFVQTYRQVSRPLKPQRRIIEARQWAEDTVQLARSHPSAENAEIVVHVTPREFALEIDPDLLTQLGLNLLKNAAEAAGEGAKISLSITRTDDGRARIEVDDNGPGVPAEMQGDIFLPFLTTKPSGTGVGLSLVRQIALAHGGSVSVGTGALGGAAFRVLL